MSRVTAEGLGKIPKVQLSGPYAGFGEHLVAQLKPSFQYTWTYGLPDIRLNTTEVVGSGTALVDNAVLIARTGATPSSKQVIETRRYLQYRAGFGGRLRFTAAWEGVPGVGGRSLIGLSNDVNGYQIGYLGSDFGFLHKHSGVETFYPYTSWKGRKFDPTKSSPFEIIYQYLGSGQAWVNVVNPHTRGFEFLVSTDWIDNYITANLTNPALPFRMEVQNSASGEELGIRNVSVGAFNDGAYQATGLHFGVRGYQVNIPAAGVNMFTLRSGSLFNGVENRVPTVLQRVGASNGANNRDGYLRVIKNATSVGAVFSPVDVNTPIEIDLVGAWSGGRVVIDEPIVRLGQIGIDVVNYDIQLIKDETLTFEMSATTGTLTEGNATAIFMDMR